MYGTKIDLLLPCCLFLQAFSFYNFHRDVEKFKCRKIYLKNFKIIYIHRVSHICYITKWRIPILLSSQSHILTHIVLILIQSEHQITADRIKINVNWYRHFGFCRSNCNFLRHFQTTYIMHHRQQLFFLKPASHLIFSKVLWHKQCCNCSHQVMSELPSDHRLCLSMACWSAS